MWFLHVVAGGMNGSIVYELERPENAGLEKSVKVRLTIPFFLSSFLLLIYYLCNFT
jgi:hypothetical protein